MQTYIMRALIAIMFALNRTGCRRHNTSDNLALSDVIIIIKKWPKSSSKTAKFTSRKPQRRLSARRPGMMFPCRRCRATAPSPLLSARTGHQLISLALPIVAADMSKPRVPPTRAKPMPLTGSIFQRGAGGQIWLNFPRIRKPSGSISLPALPARLSGAQKRTQSRPSNAASPRSPGTMPSVASRSIARTGTSPL